MAKSRKKKINKSQEVRDELAKSKTGSPSEVVERLAKRDIEVSPAFVSNIKSQTKKRNGPKSSHGSKIANSKSPSVVNSVPVGNDELSSTHSLFEQAVDLVLQAGPKRSHILVDMADTLIKKIRK